MEQGRTANEVEKSLKNSRLLQTIFLRGKNASNCSHLSSELKQLEPAVRNRDVGNHLLGVEDLLGKHELVEAQVNAQGTWLTNVSNQANIYIRSKGEQYDVLQRKLDDVTAQYYSSHFPDSHCLHLTWWIQAHVRDALILRKLVRFTNSSRIMKNSCLG
ncbi:unnamed protein product [Cylicocyclus nassatus]|uniref:Uncharacterized protein n=1 Tax=Cylicocyclus nassatus TaxID=53992 RepID=A0AA36DQC7_CYLNA|nr:unnamed protein product [Cylicocyclus nassatus]